MDNTKVKPFDHNMYALLDNLPFFTILWGEKDDKYVCIYSNKKNLHLGSLGMDITVRTLNIVDTEIILDDYIKENGFDADIYKKLTDFDDSQTQTQMQIQFQSSNKSIYLTKLPGGLIHEIHYEICETNSNLLKIINHKIRNPLTSIIGIITLFNDINLTETQKKYVNILKNASCDIICVANDLIDIINFENSKMRFNIGKHNLKNVLASITDDFKDNLKIKKLSIQLNYSSLLPTTIMCDKDRVSQFMKNFIKNAIDHVETGRYIINVASL